MPSELSPIPAAQSAPVMPFEAPPLVSLPRSAASRALAVRVWSLFSIGIAGSMFAVGLWLTPSPDGFGKTRGLFGMPPCGFYESTGYPCPTCGCTTAVSWFSHGHPLASLLTQPFGFTVAVAGVLTIILCMIGVVTGRWVGPDSFTLGWHWRKFLFGGLAIFLGGWIYKALIIRMQLHPV